MSRRQRLRRACLLRRVILNPTRHATNDGKATFVSGMYVDDGASIVYRAPGSIPLL